MVFLEQSERGKLNAMEFEHALSLARGRPDDDELLSNLARTALAEAREEAALPLLRRAAERRPTALMWQWTGLLERALDEHQEALESFAKAAALAPMDKSIAHGRARVALEGGVPAARLFEAALHLSRGDPDILLGYSASLLADGNAEAAEQVLASIVERSPLWINGHMQLAQLRSTIGKKEQATSSLERSIELQPKNEQLWIALFRLLVQMQQFARLDEAISRARSHSCPEHSLLRYEAIAAIEQCETERADRLLASMSADLRQSVEVWSVRHLLRTGRIAAACAAIDAALRTELAPDIWPYAASVWRLAKDPRWEWLEGDLDRLVSVIDLTGALGDLSSLEQVLRRLHAGKGEFLDQSVRGGSQTDGPLFTHIDPQIRSLRSAIVSAVRQHVENLPARDARHPLLAPPRDRPTRFSGSWSVFLRGGGYHANHVHPQGWISSALYIRLPDRGPGEPANAGWLTLGEPQAELKLDLSPYREIEPMPGRLVLFPSYMWHGTRPFSEGERITVAFDVQPPN